jgi:hypothetical protein
MATIGAGTRIGSRACKSPALVKIRSSGGTMSMSADAGDSAPWCEALEEE